MNSITMTKRAEQAIEEACSDPAADPIRQHNGTIPLLLWSTKTVFIANSGNRSEFGPQFYLYLTSPREISGAEYAIFLTSNGNEIALCPGEMFRNGIYNIDFSDGAFTIAE